MNCKTFAPLATLAALCAFAGTASAQATIDHKKALAGNVTPGDAAGYPITLTQPGHYKLMSKLAVPAGTAGIVIAADGVTLDLNGFTVQGPGVCTRTYATGAVSCVGSSNKIGIDAGGFEATVRNGTVRGFGGGLILQRGVVEQFTATHNAGNGMGLAFLTDPSYVVRGSELVATLNGGDGIKAGQAMLDRVVSQANGGYGIAGSYSLGHTVVTRSQTAYNALVGLGYATVQGTVSVYNLFSNTTEVRSLGNNLMGNTAY